MKTQVTPPKSESNPSVAELRKKYAGIVLWCKQMGSFDYYIDNQVVNAEADGAPVDAIYENTGPGGVDTGEWRTIRDLGSNHPFRSDYAKYLATLNS